MPLVSGLIPTHDHALTLPISVASVQAQSIDDIEIIIIGDDDLLFSDHLETMINAIDGHDFAHPIPVFIDPDGSLRYETFDATKGWWRATVHPPMDRNAVSLTGIMHTLDSYRRLPYGWRATPPGIYTDQYMWQQYFDLTGFRGVSTRRATTVKLAAIDRERLSPSERAEELSRWWSRVRDPQFRPVWDARVAQARRRDWWRNTKVAAQARAQAAVARLQRTTEPNSQRVQ